MDSNTIAVEDVFVSAIGASRHSDVRLERDGQLIGVLHHPSRSAPYFAHPWQSTVQRGRFRRKADAVAFLVETWNAGR